MKTALIIYLIGVAVFTTPLIIHCVRVWRRGVMKYIELAYAWIICLTVDKRRSILIEHSFNSWKWPFMYFGSYYNSIPNYDKNKSIDTKYYVFRKIMDYLRSRSNQFERLRYHNVEAIMSMTEDEFIIWFEEHSIFR